MLNRFHDEWSNLKTNNHVFFCVSFFPILVYKLYFTAAVEIVYSR